MTSKEIKSLTGIRGIASLYVCLFHFYQYYSLNNKNSPLVKSGYFSTIASHGYLSVDLFFMLSAFVLTLSSAKLFDGRINISNYKLFMQRRFIRVYPSYFFIVLVTFVFIFKLSHFSVFLFSLTLLNSLFGVPYMLNNHWSLGVEWVTYLLFPVFYKFSGLFKNNWWTCFLAILGLMTLYVNGLIYSKTGSPDFLLVMSSGYYGIVRCFGGYLLGMAAFNVFKYFKTEIPYKNSFAVTVSVCLFISLAFAEADVVTVFLFMLLLISIAKDSNIIARILSSKVVYFLGVISYPLYLIHFPICLNLQAIYLAVQKLNTGLSTNLNLFILYLISCIALSTVFTYYIELPTIKYLNILSRKNNKNFTEKTMILDESKLKN